MNAFITGSRAYGKPKKASDVDLVVLVSPATEHKLRKLSGAKPGRPIMFGKLNLVLCTDEVEFAVWKVGTEHLSITGPHSTKEAIQVLDALRMSVDLIDQAQSGP